jgi:hypothetical protein
LIYIVSIAGEFPRHRLQRPQAAASRIRWWRTRESDQRGGEWEPIKITHSNLAYIPNLKIRHALSLGKNVQVLSLGQNGQDLTLGKTGQVLSPGKNWWVLSLGKIGQNGQANSDKFSAMVKTDEFSALVKSDKSERHERTSKFGPVLNPGKNR